MICMWRLRRIERLLLELNAKVDQLLVNSDFTREDRAVLRGTQRVREARERLPQDNKETKQGE
jgi:hypothetical protein